MFRTSRSRLLRAVRKYFPAILLAGLCALVILRLSIHDSGTVARDRRLELTREFEQLEDVRGGGDHADAGIVSPTVHLVVAATAAENISWAYKLNIPNLLVIHYVADDPTALHHPTANRGHEAMIYHSYFYEFTTDYPKLPF